ncbi:MAG: dimethylsulfoniopropionate lyase [Gammaproteobacteria bacterium]|nr:dimethylsulfoniopropionate lyase [Gammaproteobacteria bacterium]MDH3856880.1 dimethylsulfoniopropionate lyase [Gammaproteobacteria bacterium]
MNAWENELEELNDLIWHTIAARQDIVNGRQIEIPQPISTARQDSESRFSDNFPVLQHLDQALSLVTNFDLAEIAGRFSRVMDNLRWSQNPNYDDNNSSRSFLDGYAYVGISGPDAPIRCAVPRGGLVLLGPGVVYPSHHHEPKEVYLVLTPGSQWCLDEGDWFDVAPGDLVFHDSWQMHAMRTRDKPLLAFAGWLDAGDRRDIGWSDNNASTSCG